MTPHLYIHIPFCESKCPYCAFESGVLQNVSHEDYINAVIKTIPNEPFETVYIGGGTPSVISAKFYEPLFAKFKYANEITIEANPSSANYEWLKTIKELGANRLSLGVQSVKDDKLKLLGRVHSANEAKIAVLNANKVGFTRISVDLIYDTILDSPQSVCEELDEILTWTIDHISLYALTIEENTPFFYSQNVCKPNEQTGFMLADKLSANGFEHYEVASFGKTKCAHNIGYWSGAKYYGAGFGAVGFDGAKRYKSSAKNVKDFINNPYQKEYEELSEQDLEFESLFLGLRSNVGVSRSALSKAQAIKADELVAHGKLKFATNRYFNNNFWISDEIVLYLTS